MRSYQKSFQLFYQLDKAAGLEFRIRNHVDLLVNERIDRANRLVKLKMETTLRRKFRYRDTRAEMGLWLFDVGPASWQSIRLVDCDFEAFPAAFEYVEEIVPDIFDGLG